MAPAATARLTAMDASSSDAQGGQSDKPQAVVAAKATTTSASRRKENMLHDYKGFVAGIFSGIAKLTGTKTPHPPPSSDLGSR